MSRLFRADRPDELIEQALAGPSPDTVAIINNLGQLLVTISHQLDILIKLECNFLTRRELKARLIAIEAAQNAAAQVEDEQLEGQTSIDEALDDSEVGDDTAT